MSISASKQKKYKIVIIDDDTAIVDVISIILEGEGNLVYKKDGTSISDILKSKPDLILLDMMLSGIDGRDLCKKLKKNPKSRKIPIIMISAHHDARGESLNSGADAFISKPFDISDLKSVVSGILVSPQTKHPL